MINIEVEKNNNENNVALLRRFTKKVQGSGVLPRVRSLRYKTRNQSPLAKKKIALKKIAKRKMVEELQKLGKMPEKTGRRR